MCCNLFTLAHQSWSHPITLAAGNWPQWTLVIAEYQDCSSRERQLLSVHQHTAGEITLLSTKYLLIIIWGGLPTAPLWGGETFSPIFISLDIGNNFGPWSITRSAPAISNYLPAFCYYNEMYEVRKVYGERVYFPVWFLRFQVRIRWPVVLVLCQT